jgi:hypothetical protein
MAEGTISIGNTTLDTPVGYKSKENKLEVFERTPYGVLIINRNTNAESQPISVYSFEISDVVNSKMLAIKAEVAKIGNLYLIDYLQIVEVLSGDGTTTTFYTQRMMSGSTPVPIVTLTGTAKTVTVTNSTDPSAGNVYAKADVSGRARFIFGDVPPDVDDNIIIQYEPKFSIRITDYIYTGRIKDVGNYTLICEEV